MLQKMQNDTFIFSGLKTHAQLLEASTFLRDESGQIRSFESFAHQFNKVNQNYNQNYLQAEHQFAVSSSQSAANWAALDEDGRYYLQYRTANDDRVRDSHRILQDTTLPKDDLFWLSYYPPNGWRCRCVAVEVLHDKYKLSDSEKSIQLGEKATTQIGADGKNKLAIFRFNPGAEQKVFPPKHPYNKVKGAEDVRKILEPKFTPKKIKDYEKKLGINVNRQIFQLLEKETPLYFSDPKGYPNKKGAYYSPSGNFVKIPIDQRRKDSKWYAEGVVYHEFGHAIDNHRDLRSDIALKGLMEKYRTKFSEDNNKLYKTIDKRLNKFLDFANKKANHDLWEKTAAGLDTLMSLNPNFGKGHTITYFANPGKKEAEFIAHSFENAYSGNEVFKKVMPELYDDMVKWIKDIKPKK